MNIIIISLHRYLEFDHNLWDTILYPRLKEAVDSAEQYQQYSSMDMSAKELQPEIIRLVNNKVWKICDFVEARKESDTSFTTGLKWYAREKLVQGSRVNIHISDICKSDLWKLERNGTMRDEKAQAFLKRRRLERNNAKQEFENLVLKGPDTNRWMLQPAPKVDILPPSDDNNDISSHDDDEDDDEDSSRAHKRTRVSDMGRYFFSHKKNPVRK